MNSLVLACSNLLGRGKDYKYAPKREGKNILITSSSAKIPLITSVKKAISKISDEIIVYCADAMSDVISKYFADVYWNMPRISDISCYEIISYCKKENIGFIIPTRDDELQFFASIKKDLEKEKISTMIADIGSVNICLNKQLLYQTCKSFDLPIIETDVDIAQINSQKYVVKEKCGSGSKSIGIGLTYDEAILHANTLHAPVFQPFIKGKEYSIDTYMTNTGIIKGVVARERVRIKDGEAKITQKVEYQSIEDIATTLVRKINIYGHSVTQIIVDGNSNPHIVECNSRFGGASTLSVACGLDSFYWFILESMGVDISKYPFIKQRRPLKMIRYETDLII
jgi:carbamoyl-phosphate synthase large subunit